LYLCFMVWRYFWEKLAEGESNFTQRRRGFTQRRKEGFHATAQRRNVISCITLRRCAVA